MSFFRRFDWWIFFSALALSGLGLLIQLSVAPKLVNSQLLYIILGLVLFFLFSQIDLSIYYSFKIWLYIFSFLGLLFTLIIGLEIRGSTRWLNIGTYGIQPSELFKPLMIIFLSLHFSSSGNKNKKLFSAFLLLVPMLILIFKQPDLGNTIVYFFIFLSLVFSLRYYRVILGSLVLSLIMTPLFWRLLHDYQRKRIFTFLNPGLDPRGTGYNALQATIAVGSGGLLGKGIGGGTQSHLQFLPEHHTDFIFASFAEEFGFIGALILLSLYAFLLLRIIYLARKSRSRESSLICIGIFAMLFCQIFINIGMNVGIVPITGITLPLISYGGSSIFSTMISLGVVESLIKAEAREETLYIK